MEKIQKLVKKLRKLRPWLIPSLILFVIGFICWLTLLFVKIVYNIFIPITLITLLPLILAFIPYGIAAHIVDNVANEIKNIFCDRLKAVIDDAETFENIDVTIDYCINKVNLIYSITISSDSVALDKLSATLKEIADNMTCELNHIFIKEFVDYSIYGINFTFKDIITSK